MKRLFPSLLSCFLILAFSQQARAVTALIYKDNNSSGNYTAGEDDNTFANGNGGATHAHAYDVDLPGNPSTSEVIVDFAFIDNSFSIAINGVTSACAPAVCQLEQVHVTAAQSLLRFPAGFMATPWLTNNNGLPRVRVIMNGASITILGTRLRSSTVLEPMTFAQGGLAGLPTFVQGQNTVTVTNPNEGGPDGTNGTIAGTFSNYNPSITIAKSRTPATITAAGQDISYSFLVTNGGDYQIDTATVTDPLVTVTCPTSGANTIVGLAVGASETCTGTYTVSQSDMDNAGGGDNDIDNTVSVTGTSATLPVNDDDSAATALTITPSLDIGKSATLIKQAGNTATNAEVGDQIDYVYTVTNNGNVTMTNVDIGDVHSGAGPFADPASETFIADNSPFSNSSDATANNGIWSNLAPGDIIEFAATYIVTQTDVDNQ